MRREILLNLPSGDGTIQARLRAALTAAIVDGQIPAGEAVPSCRNLAKRLGVARNTVALTYQGLVDEGFLIARERSGYYVNGEILDGRVRSDRAISPEIQPSWTRRLKVWPSTQRNIEKPREWRKCPYPFIYGQADPALFPLPLWRDCSRQALGRLSVENWVGDSYGRDDPELIDEVRMRVLPRRGVRAREDEILITLGAQNALYLLSMLLLDARTTIGLEDPGYVDARNIFRLRTARVTPLPVDEQGVVIGAAMQGCDYVYLTPSHQSPTTAILPLDRRHAVLARAAARRFVIIEDDYEVEINYVSEPTSALKALDTHGHVVYVGSFSKSVAPGLRLGYMVGPAALIAEARALRRLVLRQPPANNQRTMALFLAGGHYDALLHRLHRVFHERWQALGAALAQHLPEVEPVRSSGGTSYWVRGPERLDAGALARTALAHGLVIEPGAIHFLADDSPRNYFRLGFSSIPLERIEPGVNLLAGLLRAQLK
jgi:GntR family transcriptional regulator/MocR family aminotransferase